MISGLYTAASGLIAQTEQQDVIANNLANVNTNGYKKDRTLFMTFPEVFLHRINDEKVSVPGGFSQMMVPIGKVGKGVQLQVDGVRPAITEEGSLINTDNKMHFAIKGNGMFTIMTPQGIRYTRDGNFSLDADGKMVTMNGNTVLGQTGEIIIDGNELHVDEGGRIFVDDYEMDTFRIGLFEQNTPLRKEGDNLFYTLDGTILPQDDYMESTQLMQGYLESSNVNVVREMVDMITAFRAYEASQKAITAQDETLGKAVGEVGTPKV
jgi:flagellar basal-body rod protein FlgF